MVTQVTDIENCPELSCGEGQRELSRFSITAVAALLHVLRKRADMPSDYATLQFNVAQLEVVPLHADGTEFTAEEVTADALKRRDTAQGDGAAPTSATRDTVA